MLRRAGTPLVLVVVAALLAACGAAAPRAARRSPTTTIPVVRASADGPGLDAFYRPPSPLPPAPPGTLIRREIVSGVPGMPPGATLWRVLYHSRSIYNADVAESGYVVVPPGPAPAGGFPVLSWAHGTTGVADVCAPSRFDAPTVSKLVLVPDLASFTASGFVIAATDYEGLGTPGVHPYLVGESEGRSVLDAARAAGHLPGVRTSPTVIVYGHSQGGHAALFAGELAPRYAPELRLAGVVAAAPATNLSTVMSVAGSPAAAPAMDLLMMGAYAWTSTYRDLPASDVFTPTGSTLAAELVPTLCGFPLHAALAARHATPQLLFRPDLAVIPAVSAHARLNDPGRVHTTAPLLVVQGTADLTVPNFLTDSYVVTMACPDSDTIDYLHYVGASHSGVLTAAAGDITAWIGDRLAGRPPPTTCGAPGDVRTIG